MFGQGLGCKNIMNLEDFITGERFQALADVSVIPEGDSIGESNCDFVIKQQQNNNYKAFYYNALTNILPDYVQNARVIFVNIYTLDKFFSKIFPLLKNKYIFVSHNSDSAFTDSHINYLNDNKVIKWYSQNKTLNHEKLLAIPIGIANQQYTHGNLQLLKQIQGYPLDKKYLAYKNFDLYTNFQARSYIDHITSQNGIVMSSKVDQTNYLTSLAESIFCVSPPGNGVDCHRVWECLYLKTIPIIKYDDCYDQFKHLPILFVDDWHSVTADLLNASIINFQHTLKNTLPELSMSYWKKNIYE
jgi:hypothetical protein